MRLDAIAARPIGLQPSRLETSRGEASGGEAFAEAMHRMLQGVNRDQLEAAQKIQNLTVDGKGSIHETMIAVSKAEGSFRLLMEMRNRIIDGVNQLLQAST